MKLAETRRLAASILCSVVFCAGCARTPVVHVGQAEGVILPASVGPRMFPPCSGNPPARPDGYWQPSPANVVALEAQLEGFLKSHPPDYRPDLPVPLSSYKRQYIGLIRGDTRSIYVNLFAMPVRMSHDWRFNPVRVCDGGASFLGLEYDVTSARFIHISYNGTG